MGEVLSAVQVDQKCVVLCVWFVGDTDNQGH